MKEIFRFINSLFSCKQKIVLVVSLLFPLILAGILFLISWRFGFDLPSKDIKIYLVLMWVVSVISFSMFFLFFIFHASMYRKFQPNLAKISNSIVNLLENRLVDRQNFYIFLCFSILSYYFLTLLPYIIEINKDNIFSITMTIPIFFILTLFLSFIRNTYIGLREKYFNRFSVPILLIFIWASFYLINISSIINISLNSTDVVKIIKDNIYWFIPLIVAVVFFIFEKFKARYPKKIIHRWERSLTNSDLLQDFFLSWIFIGLLTILTLLTKVIPAIGLINLQPTFVVMSSFIGLIVLASYFFVKPYAYSFIKNMINWDEFFNSYQGAFSTYLNQSYGELIKIKGECTSISVNEKYQDKFEYFNQHFLLKVNGTEQLIDVISLEEKTSFRNYLPIVSEGNSLLIIGELKSILDDDFLVPINLRVSNVVIAHHVELLK